MKTMIKRQIKRQPFYVILPFYPHTYTYTCTYTTPTPTWYVIRLGPDIPGGT
jgi:hypothetical protein